MSRTICAFLTMVMVALVHIGWGQDPAPQRIDVKWILRYEQAYGLDGLYVEEPPAAPSDRDAVIRGDLVELTLAGKRFRNLYPNSEPTPSLMFLRNVLEREIRPPSGIEYRWAEASERFVATPPGDGAADIVAGSLLQIEGADRYRRTVALGSAELNRNWQVLADDPETPELIKREIEARRYAARQTQTEAIHLARRTQALLRELNDSIELAMAAGMLTAGAEITMQDVGRTGLIDLLERLPLEGEYVVTRAGEPPSALIRGRAVPFAPSAIVDALRIQAEEEVAARPDYAPAIAVLARYQAGEKARETITRAISLWPDVPAFRIQRLATNAKLGHYEAFTEDLDMIVERFPAAPLLLEIDSATYNADLSQSNQLRASLIVPLAEIRPEVLNVQLLALKALTDIGDIAKAKETRDGIVARHPGYRPLLQLPDEVSSAGESAAGTNE